MNESPQSTLPLPHLARATAAHAPLSNAAAALVDDDLSAARYFRRLLHCQLYSDAVRFLPHALPKRAAVWWGCLCLWREYRDSGDCAALCAIDACVAWVCKQDEPSRQAAEKQGRALGCLHPAGGLAMAVFWTSGNVLVPNMPPVDPHPQLTARAVSGALLTAAGQFAAGGFAQRLREYAELGSLVAQGRALWTPDGLPMANPPQPSTMRGDEAEIFQRLQPGNVSKELNDPPIRWRGHVAG